MRRSWGISAYRNEGGISLFRSIQGNGYNKSIELLATLCRMCIDSSIKCCPALLVLTHQIYSFSPTRVRVPQKTGPKVRFEWWVWIKRRSIHLWSYVAEFYSLKIISFESRRDLNNTNQIIIFEMVKYFTKHNFILILQNFVYS